MDESDLVSMADVDGDAATDEVVSNGDLANRRRRQQVRQACQQCRRRKIKVRTPFFHLQPAILTFRRSATRFGQCVGLVSRQGLPVLTSFRLGRLVPKLCSRASSDSETSSTLTLH